MAVHPKHVSRMETGANTTVATLVAAAVAYDVKLRDLFGE